MTIVRRLWLAVKYVAGGIASLGGLACLAFVAGGFVWGIAKGITGTMSDPSGWNEWLSILGGGALILFGLIIVLSAIRELLKYIFVLPRRRSHKLTWGWCTFLLFGVVLLVEGAFCITDAPVFKVPLVVVTAGMVMTLFLEGREEAKFTKELVEAEARARQHDGSLRNRGTRGSRGNPDPAVCGDRPDRLTAYSPANRAGSGRYIKSYLPYILFLFAPICLIWPWRSQMRFWQCGQVIAPIMHKVRLCARLVRFGEK